MVCWTDRLSQDLQALHSHGSLVTIRFPKTFEIWVANLVRRNLLGQNGGRTITYLQESQYHLKVQSPFLNKLVLLDVKGFLETDRVEKKNNHLLLVFK